MGKLLLGVDIGSSGLKAVILDIGEGIIASASAPVALFSDHAGWAEAETSDWWNGLCKIIPELLEQAKCSASDIAAIAVSGMVPAVVVCDSEGNVLRRAILQNDARATNEIKDLAKKLGGVNLLVLTGSQLTQQSVAPTALWLSKNESDVWEKTRMILGSYDWMAIRLGASPHVERNWAIESGLYGWDRQPLKAVIDSTDIAWPPLQEPKNSGEKVGEVSERAALETGLARGTIIVVGGADHVLSAYGAGLVNQGDCLVKLGGAGDILVVSDKPLVDARLYLDSHPMPNKWLPNGCMATSGSLLRWEQNLFGGVELTVLDSEAADSDPGLLITLPYFLGEKSPLHDPDLRGVISGLHLGTTRGDIHRSFLESIAYGFRQHFEIFAECGLEITNPKVTNGGSKSRLWRMILADVLDIELTSIMNHPGASYGAAIAAGIGVEVISDWSFVEGALEVGEVIAPNPKNRDRYENRYQDFIELQKNTTDISHRLARVI